MKQIARKIKDWVSKYNAEGKEIMDPVPVAVHLGKRNETIDEKIMRMVRSREIQNELARMGEDTFDEYDDFDVGDDDDKMPETPYETCFDPRLGKEIYKREKALLDAQEKAYKPPVRKGKPAEAEQREEPQGDKRSASVPKNSKFSESSDEE